MNYREIIFVNVKTKIISFRNPFRITEFLKNLSKVLNYTLNLKNHYQNIILNKFLTTIWFQKKKFPVPGIEPGP